MSLTGVVDELTHGERARYPHPLMVEAYFDGWNQAVGHSPITFPRFLDRAEEREWRLGWADGKTHRPTDPDPTEGQDDEPDVEHDETPGVEVAQVHPADTTGSLPRWFTDAEPAELAPYPPVDGSQPCAQTDPDAWFPDKGDNPRAAKRMCDSCRFLHACRDYAVDRPDLIGMWGGTTVRERQELRAQRKQVAA